MGMWGCTVQLLRCVAPMMQQNNHIRSSAIVDDMLNVPLSLTDKTDAKLPNPIAAIITIHQIMFITAATTGKDSGSGICLTVKQAKWRKSETNPTYSCYLWGTWRLEIHLWRQFNISSHSFVTRRRSRSRALLYLSSCERILFNLRVFTKRGENCAWVAVGYFLTKCRMLRHMPFKPFSDYVATVSL